MMSLRIGCDLDGVVADFRSGFASVASDVLSWGNGAPADLRDLSEADARRVWKVITETPTDDGVKISARIAESNAPRFAEFVTSGGGR